MDPDRERALLARWEREGDVGALDELLREEVRVLRDRLRQGAWETPSVDASDVAQEAVARFLEAGPALPSPAALRTYLWTTARRALIDRLRRARRSRLEVGEQESQSLRVDPEASGGLGRVEEADLAVALEVVLNLLRPADQEILQRVYLRGLSIEEAARDLGLERDVANTRLVRARVRLAERLAAWREVVDA